ncbi:hypothetical protein C2857_004997 [Epichloe festucae Fl1]|uniref:Uncharacterized protein n=1 Tax=Epichloe festucae (strain Fl1) TaxID=877507 RepID=A0A7S9KSJ2_EPIFF|nr:hypothetical protein C2857_004997 [Epichloe festucae Fl1]
MPTTKPKLEKLSTPATATFPSEIASATTATPLSAATFPSKMDPDFIKTPISPPSAYTDFLSKAMALNSPSLPSGDSSPDSAKSVPETVPETERADHGLPKSEAPSPTSTASSKSTSPLIAPAVPPSPFPTSAPMSAPPTSAASFPSLKLPPSPAMSNIDSPLSASTMRSPFSARSVHSVFDWDAALKARFSDKKHKASRTSVRHIREVVTRTVTYTPRMDPAPRGKRQRVE